ncbi:hypothetical protein C5167_039335 [Papaver somniferum]|uniref:CTLH domain-containing protein n=1 Tax=Papaver somniferum TaxID=3469 RepID=A0A4Y7IFC1_PAPSO|nr:hypothetical protein C5167_039335 [Papaver somniferum]
MSRIMSNSEKEALFMILQALYEVHYEKTAHKFEQESGIFFNIKYFENELRNGNWDEVENYLLGFTELTSNQHSVKLFFEIRKQRYLEALDRKQTEKAMDMLVKDLKVFKTFDEKVYSDMTGLLGLENFRENEHLKMYVDENSARAILFDAAKDLIQANPLFKDNLIRQILPPQQEENLMSNPFPLRLVPQLEENLKSNPFGLRPVPAGYAYRNVQNNEGVASFAKYQNSENAWLTLAKAADEVTITCINEIKEQDQCRSLCLPDKLKCNKISRLMCANSGRSILALASNAMHLLWKWEKTEASASVFPEIWEPRSGKLMVNDLEDVTNKETEPCFSMSNNEVHLISTSGGNISVFSTATFERLSAFMPPPPACTCLIFYPEDNNILIIGAEDSNIMIYDLRKNAIIETLKGHLKKITGLAYSKELKVLVSLDAETQICVWKCDTWDKQNTAALQIPAGRNSASAIGVQYQNDQIHFLVVHQMHLAIYETVILKRLKQWVVPKSSAHITDATLSSKSEMIFASFLDATILIFGVANLQPVWRIQPSAYLHAISSPNVYPTAIDAHPTKNQFALGPSDGGVCVIEPLHS